MNRCIKGRVLDRRLEEWRRDHIVRSKTVAVAFDSAGLKIHPDCAEA